MWYEVAMKISVIIPVYNCEKYLRDCLESVIKQSYKELEIILIDDGSTDSSGSICDYYAEMDSRVQVIHQKNKGVSASRNAGMLRMSGELVSFIDADDTLDLDMYEFLYSLMETYDADIVHCGYRHVVGDEIRLVHDSHQIIEQNKEEALKCLIGAKLFVGSLWNKLYKAELFKEIRLPIGIAETEDLLCNFELFCLAESSFFYDVSKYHYMLRSGSATSETLSEKKRRDRYYVVSYIMSKVRYDDIYYGIAYERYLRILIENAMQKDYSKLQKESLERLRKESGKALFSKDLGLRVKGIVIATSYLRRFYRIIRYFYNKITKIENRYEIK